MKLLALETSGAVLSLAAFEDGAFKSELSRAALMRQNESLAPLCAELLESCSWKAAELTALAVSLGPGSFTGLRTGLAFAKGLHFATGAKILGISTLEAWAEGRDAEVWLDARRGQVYRAAFKDGKALGEPRMLSLDEARSLRMEALPLLGDVEGCSGSLSAAQVGRLGLKRLARGESDEPALIEPLYMRRSEAEILWDKRHAP